MTPAQQAALQALISRPLTQGEIDAIDPHLAYDARNDVAIAQVLSIGRRKVVPTPIGYGTILAVMAPHGGAFLDLLEALAPADSNVKWLLKLIDRGAFDLSLEASRSQMQAYANAHPELASGITALLAVAEVADPMDVNTVSNALNVAEGRQVL